MTDLLAPGSTGLADLIELAGRFETTEYASLTRAGAPITWPVTPYVGDDGRTVDVTTGVTYPLKAERARRDPRVALSFTHPLRSDEGSAHVVVQGLATVRDADLVATSRRYLEACRARFPEDFGQIPRFLLARMAWYWARMWIEVTPTQILWWEGGDLSAAPRVWAAPAGTVAPPSDPAPAGRTPGSWNQTPPPDWRTRAAGAVDRLGLPVVTLLDAQGAPLPLPVRSVEAIGDGFVVGLPAGVAPVDGPAFVSFHATAEEGLGQENIGLAGHAVVEGSVARVTVDRSLNDWGITPGKVRGPLSMVRNGRRVRPRLEAEAARRGQPVPTLRSLGC